MFFDLDDDEEFDVFGLSPAARNCHLHHLPQREELQDRPPDRSSAS